jgi:hypothetical protein
MVGLLILGCNNSKINNEILSNSEWNTISFNYIKHSCGIDLDSIKFASHTIPTKLNKKEFYTLEEYFQYCFEYREILLNYITENIKKDIKVIKIYEYYGMRYVDYKILLSDELVVSLRIVNGSEINIKEDKDDRIFFTYSDEDECFSNFEGLPQHVQLWSCISESGIKLVRLSFSNQ